MYWLKVFKYGIQMYVPHGLNEILTGHEVDQVQNVKVVKSEQER